MKHLQSRRHYLRDSKKITKTASIKCSSYQNNGADPNNEHHIGATMPGTVIKVLVEKGEKVERGDHLIISNEDGNDC